MRQLKLFLLLSIMMVASTARAQTTNVTATVLDPNSNAYGNGTVSVSFVPQGLNQPSVYRLNGSTFTQSYSTTTNSSGLFTITLPDNNVILPGGSKWQFQVCSLGGTCFQAQVLITGASQNISTALNAQATPILGFVISVGNPWTASQTATKIIAAAGQTAPIFQITDWLGNALFSVSANGTVTCSGGCGGGAPSGPAGGDLGGTFPNPTVTGLGGVALPNIGASNGFLKSNNGASLTFGLLQSADIPNNSATAGNISGIAAVPNGGSGAASFTVHALLAGEGTAAFNPICGSGITGQLFQANNGADPSCVSPGITVRTASANDTILCDSATAIRDRGNLVVYTASLTATIPDPSASGCGGGFFVTVIDQTGTTTVNRTTTATFTVCQGFSTTCTASLTTFNLLVGQRATFASDNTNWYVYITGGIPVVAGCTASASHILCYDPTGGNTHIRTNGVDSVAVAETSIQAAGFLLKQNDATDGKVVASLCDEGITTANTLTCANTAGLAVSNGPVKVGTAPACVPGGAGGLCATEGTAPTNVASTAALYADSTAHELKVATNGSASFGLLERVQPSPINQTSQTAAITTATLCAASAGACNVAGQYHVHWNFWGSGTACSSVTAGSVTFLLTWTDENAVTHSAVALNMMSQTGAATTAMQASFPFQTALANESASGDVTISTNGTVIQYATGYTACTTGTGTYNLRAAVTRVQ